MEEKASASFWDKLWNDNDLKKTIETGARDWFVTRITKKYIPPTKSSKILEGGCGRGQYVYSLDKAGYDAYGVDYAPRIVAKLNSIFPLLKISHGDVRKLEFPNASFDGYWSLGVIEHFFDGYADIIKEMHRVVKPGGYVFITFPCLSPLRKLKAKMKKYPTFDEHTIDRDSFYQFALDPKVVQNDLKKAGFHLIHTKRLDGIKGLKDEIPSLRPFLQSLYSSKILFFQVINGLLSRLFAPFCHHSILLILKKYE